MYENLIKEQYTFADLKEIIAALRSEQGCPWDRVQTHESLKSCIKEEAYEVIEAIDELPGDLEASHLKEELGDVLLQVMMHSQIASEERRFSVEDVIQGVAEKMVSRHPHVFGSVTADSAEAALDTWEKSKEKEKGKSADPIEEMERVARALPALVRCQKVIKKSGVSLERKLAAERLLKDVQKAGADPKEEQIGQLLLDVVHLSTANGISSEEALIQATENLIAEAKQERQK